MSSAIVIGATSGVGRALAEQLAKAGFDLLLVARDVRDLDATARHLRLCHSVECHYEAQDIGDLNWNVDSFAQRWDEALRGVDSLFIPAGGAVAGDDAATATPLAAVTSANYLGPARLATAFGALMRNRGGSIVLFSSVASSAPRTRNAAYSAAKAALEAYATALQHRLEPQGVRVLVVSLGYVDTAQTFGARLWLPVASPASVARYVLGRLADRAGKRHYPRFWAPITFGLRHMPWSLYRRLSF